MDKNNQLETAPIGKLVFKLAIPTVMAQLVNLLYNIVDRIYVGRIPEIGSLSLAGLGVTFPIILLVSAFAMLAGMGGASRAAVSMGEKDNDKAEKILGQLYNAAYNIFGSAGGCVYAYEKSDIDEIRRK